MNKKNSMKLTKKDIFNIFLMFLLAVALFFITFLRVENYKFNVKIGDIAEEDIRAITEIQDDIATERLRREAVKNVPIKYRISPSVQMSIKSDINILFNQVSKVQEMEDLTLKEKNSELEKNIEIELPSQTRSDLLQMDSDKLKSLELTLLDLTNQLLSPGIREEDIQYEKDNLKSTFDSLSLDDKQKEIGLLIMKKMIKPNKLLDETETERNKEQALESVDPVIIKENEIIVNKGEVIDQHKLNLIKESGLLKNADKAGIKSLLGIVILILLSTVFLYLYIFYYHNEIFYDGRYKAVLLVVVLVILLSGGIYRISPYLLPVSTGALLISVLVEPQLAIVVNMIMSVFLAFLFRLDISIIFMMFLGGSLGVVRLKDQRERSNLLMNGLIIGVTNVLVITAFGLIKHISFKDIFIRDIQVFANGIIAVVITIGSLPLWENIFNILTPVRLSELANPNQPLIKQMLLEAPGTYHHSLIVGNLAEAAAEVVGANPLLTRVGAYYHDIGKMVRPYYFKENQFGMDNPHDKLTPYESAQIILNHTVDGEKMARRYKLPEEIVRFTTEHHGTTNVAYFYYEAKKEDPNVDIMDFTYKGQKPQSKETAILMMADSVEAAVRSINDPTVEKIEDMTKKVIKGKIDAGQMDECDLTNRDIHLIQESFVNILKGIYHDRISYPDDKDDNKKIEVDSNKESINQIQNIVKEKDKEV